MFWYSSKALASVKSDAKISSAARAGWDVRRFLAPWLRAYLHRGSSVRGVCKNLLGAKGNIVHSQLPRSEIETQSKLNFSLGSRFNKPFRFCFQHRDNFQHSLHQIYGHQQRQSKWILILLSLIKKYCPLTLGAEVGTRVGHVTEPFCLVNYFGEQSIVYHK